MVSEVIRDNIYLIINSSDPKIGGDLRTEREEGRDGE